MHRSAEQLARLNPTTCRFGMGKGGIPELSNIDIAAALAMSGDQLGAHLLQLNVLGYMVPGALRGMLTLTEALVLQEIDRRRDLDTSAEIQGLLGSDDSIEIRAVRMFTNERWPQDLARIDKLTALAVHEMVGPDVCWTCNGNGPKTRFGRGLMAMRRLRKGMTAAEIVETAMPRREMTEKHRSQLYADMHKAVQRHLEMWREAGILTSRKVKQLSKPDVDVWSPACPHCFGTGHRPMSEQKIADFMGLSMSGWRSAQTSHAFLGWLRRELNDKMVDAGYNLSAALEIA